MANSQNHLMSMLWGQSDARVHAFIRGGVLPELPERLAVADVHDWDCLWRGALSSEAQQQAPYVVDLRRDSDFTLWLLTEALQAEPNWGVLGLSQVPLLQARELGRALLEVTLPNGEVREWHWMNPNLWCELLPKLDAHQLQLAFGCMSDWVRVMPHQWQWHTLSAGQLSVQARPCETAQG